MNKIIIAGIAALVIIIGIVVFLLPHSNNTLTTSSTSTTHTTTVQSQSTQPSTTSIPSSNLTNCVSPNQTATIYNGNFSTGNYSGWSPGGGVGFGSQPANITYADEYGEYYGHPWSGYNGTYFATSFSGGLSLSQGNLTSNTFLVTEPYLNFKLISAPNNLLYIQILNGAGRPQITVHYDTFAASNNVNATSNFVNASIVMAPLLCKKAQIRLVADVVGLKGQNEFNYIAATNFYLSKIPYSTPGIIINQTFNFT